MISSWWVIAYCQPLMTARRMARTVSGLAAAKASVVNRVSP